MNLTITNNTTSNNSPIACDSYTSPSGIVKTASELFYDIIPNTIGRDSIIKIDLTILSGDATTTQACYYLPAGIYLIEI